jgi:hypothetical protein
MSEPQRERPADDPRFTFGLTYDVAAVLAEYGYPKIDGGKDGGRDFVELQQALWRFLYKDTDLGTRPAPVEQL